MTYLNSQHSPALSCADDSCLVRDVLKGLHQRPRRLPTQYLYDARGSQLFDQITRLPEYYLTRTEMAIFDKHLSEVAASLGPDTWLIELGSGSGVKTRRLLAEMDRPAGYTPIEISHTALDQSIQRLRQGLPDLPIRPIIGDFTQGLDLPDMAGRRRVVFFPGSTLGNFSASASRKLLARLAQWVGPGGGLLIGLDLVKPPQIIVPAYDDAQGVTAAFNLNLLERLNREADADFDLDGWSHRAVWNTQELRMESYLVSERRQTASIAGESFTFESGEAVWTEQSQKYTPDMLADLAPGFTIHQKWTDANDWFGVFELQTNSGPI